MEQNSRYLEEGPPLKADAEIQHSLCAVDAGRRTLQHCRSDLHWKFQCRHDRHYRDLRCVSAHHDRNGLRVMRLPFEYLFGLAFYLPHGHGCGRRRDRDDDRQRRFVPDRVPVSVPHKILPAEGV